MSDRHVFLMFDDQQAVRVDKIISFRALTEDDIAVNRTIPEDMRTRIDTTSGHFCTTTPFEIVCDLLIAATTGLAHG